MICPVAVITGASRGIGAEAAVRLAANGFDIVLAARSTRERPGKLPGTLEEVAERVAEQGRAALVQPLDVRNENEIRDAAESVYSEFGRCDVLVNNAAVLTADPLLETSTKRWQLVLDVNVTGPFLLCREFVPRMQSAGQGRIINVSSGAVAVPSYPFVSYSASKRALEGLTEGMGLQTAPHVAVNALRIDAVIWSEGLLAAEGPDAAVEAESPTLVADAIAWLVGQPIELTGQTISLSTIREKLNADPLP